jgi:uncharacterized ion transporter superfamily protein YfcC
MATNTIDTIGTGAVSLTAITLAPQVAEVAAQAAEIPVENTITLVMQVIMSLATLYKLFFYKSKTKKEENV